MGLSVEDWLFPAGVESSICCHPQAPVPISVQKKNRYITPSQLRAVIRWPGHPREGQLMCTISLSMRQ